MLVYYSNTVYRNIKEELFVNVSFNSFSCVCGVTGVYIIHVYTVFGNYAIRLLSTYLCI